eukprot:m.197938 g.197938  ORF g.197938 m.197938 type:complete len:138 (+) comp39551_c0_seq4:1090-1503(+)
MLRDNCTNALYYNTTKQSSVQFICITTLLTTNQMCPPPRHQEDLTQLTESSMVTHSRHYCCSNCYSHQTCDRAEHQEFGHNKNARTHEHEAVENAPLEWDSCWENVNGEKAEVMDGPNEGWSFPETEVEYPRKLPDC